MIFHLNILNCTLIPYNVMMVLFIGLTSCLGRVKLKLVDDDKFLGAVKDKLQLVDYKEALSIKLNPMQDISEKNLEAKDGKALTESGFWFFPKSYSMKSNSKSGKQSFRIVYYAPNEYLLMRGDSCLGFVEGNKFKKVDCTLEKAARFRICYNKLCESYLDIKNDLECIKMFLGIGGRRYEDDSNSEEGKSAKDKKKKDRSKRDEDSDDIADCKDYIQRDRHNKGRHTSNRYPYYPDGKYPGGGDPYKRPFSPWSGYGDNDRFGNGGCKEYNYGFPGSGPGHDNSATLRPEDGEDISGLSGVLDGSHLWGDRPYYC
ncbi:uncharacterized protein VICG_00750 [Vittaforma corneae ATCC 50505]|uniref:Uncharacterized protein n=1 Tax=Vittaforma corneae (strain ATCC 50505) TaxID=993615 RepID=L2GND4_VITCO|nr:uncharacterized protein VICG_00750 [Vittaforma corneae ATCC 50505]ELA42109.1 hypothetical protein VICG_00750 [Vittaforma corneae ATCC 50505]